MSEPGSTGGNRLETRLRQGLDLHQQGRLDEAEPIYREVMNEAPENFDALHLLGVVNLQKGLPGQALELFERAAAIGPSDVFVQFNRALALHALGRPEEALGCWDRVLEIKPDFVEAHHNRGNALSELKRFEEAAPSYRRALRLNPDHADALNNLGLAFRELGRAQDAIACWDRLLWLDPSRADAQANRAATLEMLKR